MLEIYYLMKTLVTTLVAVTSGCAVALRVLNRKEGPVLHYRQTHSTVSHSEACISMWGWGRGDKGKKISLEHSNHVLNID